MRKYIIPLFLLALLFGCVGSKPNLSVSLSKTSSGQLYEGDAANFDITVVNSGSADAKDFTVELRVNDVPVKTESLSLAPNSNETISASWLSLDAGDYNITATVDSGNIVSEPSPDKESKTEVSIIPAEQLNAFSVLPDKGMAAVNLFDIKGEGSKAVYTYSSNISELPQSITPYLGFIKAYLKNAKDVQIGTVDYNDSSKAVIVLVSGPISVGQMSTALILLMNANITKQSEIINGKNISILTFNTGLSTPICVWREKGWTRMVLYQGVNISETCDSILETHTTTNADMSLNKGNELMKEPPFNATLIGETRHVNMSSVEYGAAFEDEEGFYGYYATKEPYEPQNNTCYDRLTNRSMMQICEIMPTLNSSWTFAQRNVGDYSLVCVSLPKSDVGSIPIEMKALDLCYSLNFSGQERTWLRPIDILNTKKCEFPDNFTCLSYDFQNSTLLLNITHNTGETVVINGFKCSAEDNVPSSYFQWKQPIALKSNSTMSIEAGCYNKDGGMKQGELIYFNSKMYLNYSIEGSNESKVIVGNLTIKKI